MLRSLSIRDFVIVDRLDLEFEPGFTALTGETGAGKSILVDALALVLGERADPHVVRHGAERAEINAEFEIAEQAQLRAWLDDNDLVGDPGSCLLRRVIDGAGRTRAFINGRSSTLQQLREAGELLLDIHGQHMHQSLLRASAQRELLDAYAGLRELAGRVAATYRVWQELGAKRRAAETSTAALEAEREQLEARIRELDALNFSADEWPVLLGDHARFSHAASLLETAQYGIDLLSESETAVLPQLSSLRARLNNVLQHDSALQEILATLEPAQIQLQEAVYGLRHYLQRLDLDPERMQEAEQRLSAIHSAARRQRVTPEQLPELLQTLRARFDELDGSDNAAELAQREAAARDEYLDLARSLSAGRREAAQQLSEKVSAEMQTLAMTGGSFEVALSELREPGASGLETVEFLVSAHAGVPRRPLSKVASGGELSRISLAIQVTTSQIAQIPTLIFDEVDVGIGGRVAEIVGRMLKRLGARHQVLCVTHLAQVAAAADRQWRVTKSTDEREVVSRIVVLGEEERIEEIARMLGGARITETTREHAAEMLRNL